jgi:hypothetical protein
VNKRVDGRVLVVQALAAVHLEVVLVDLRHRRAGGYRFWDIFLEIT